MPNKINSKKLELFLNTSSCGIVGTPTKLYLNLQQLFVGDVVKIDRYVRVVAQEGNSVSYVMGFMGLFTDENGVCNLPYDSEFVKSYKELEDGDSINYIEVKLKEE